MWKTTINVNLSRNQFSSSFSQISVCLSVCRQHVIISIFAVNQDASINKNSKSSNSRSLKQHTLAKSISLCCFFAREIDRFIILICRYLSHQFNKIFNQDSHSRGLRIYSALALLFLFSNLSLHVYRICFETFSVNHDQTNIWITVNEFLCNVDR